MLQPDQIRAQPLDLVHELLRVLAELVVRGRRRSSPTATTGGTRSHRLLRCGDGVSGVPDLVGCVGLPPQRRLHQLGSLNPSFGGFGLVLTQILCLRPDFLHRLLGLLIGKLRPLQFEAGHRCRVKPVL
ncbi:hypothetical protein AB0B94_30710 [Micromonospora sp. NPDC048986]|uniref:hypothetical protein n=1 Tax=Micromonospora sp. NPDC048986 TaxID=3155644 RepID=UPI0033EFC531